LAQSDEIASFVVGNQFSLNKFRVNVEMADLDYQCANGQFFNEALGWFNEWEDAVFKSKVDFLKYRDGSLHVKPNAEYAQIPMGEDFKEFVLFKVSEKPQF
jgi:hypothetical protein